MWWIFGSKFSVIFPRKIGVKFITDNFTTFFTAGKEVCHLKSLWEHPRFYICA